MGTGYPPEYRKKIVELYRSGRSAMKLEQEFKPTRQTIMRWVHQEERDRGERQDGLTSDEKEELQRLRREFRKVKQERDILAKATAWFAKEKGETPDGSSNS